MEMMSFEMLKNGLIAGAAVAAVSAIAVASIGALVNDHDGGLLAFAGKWALISVVFGVVATVGYSFLHGSFGMDESGYIYLAIGLAAALTALEFVPIYGASTFAPHWQIYAALNFIFALGFGHLVPRLMG
jgi:hypothetical protein